jgi:hypothetical protein
LRTSAFSSLAAGSGLVLLGLASCGSSEAPTAEEPGTSTGGADAVGGSGGAGTGGSAGRATGGAAGKDAGTDASAGTGGVGTFGADGSVGPSFPLKLGPSASHCLVDQNDKPFFWSGDAGWSLIVGVTSEDADLYLDDRKAKGFDLVMAELIEHKFAVSAPKNAYGDAPFTAKPFATPNETYFAHADRVVGDAGARGIAVLLFPVYLGYGCGDEGWCAEVKSATTTEMRAWGRYVGGRYASFDNVVWAIGGDTDPPSDVKPKLLEIIAGIQEKDTRHLFTVHNQRGALGTDAWPGETWLTIESVYSDSITYALSRTAYQKSPAKPFFHIEAYYENEHATTPQVLRAQAYFTALAGSMGYVFGNCPIWHFGSSSSWCDKTDWKAELGNAGSVGMMHAQRLLTSRAWQSLVPDFAHTVLTAGYGTWGAADYVTAARTGDGATVVAYLPTGQTVTIDMTKVGGSQAQAWWYDPATGTSTSIGTFATSGTKDFEPPAAHDWVLVLDDASKGFGAPGG